ncbi:hypothetical protein [Carboxylicivirga sp. N1Y90]|uniref:hypothetical protein n=1 Tax=Carboxylicivirga fragile TaxID=3417571 RepID=UPI003D352B4F|nr:hypothetical protein [Marinilabiliaceae bacterium N1Y90]
MSVKRKYIKPSIEVYNIDQEISLVMASVPVDPPWGAAAPAEESLPDYPNTLKSDSPFGGDKPDYDNM